MVQIDAQCSNKSYTLLDEVLLTAISTDVLEIKNGNEPNLKHKPLMSSE